MKPIWCRLPLLLVLLWPAQLHAQNVLTWRTAYDTVEAERARASACFDTLPHSPALAQTGLAHLEAALAYLDKPEVQELANDNIYLRFRTFEVCLDMAREYSTLDQNDKALEYLNKAASVDPSLPPMVDILENDKAFHSVRNTPGYRDLVARLTQLRSLFTYAPLLSPYSPHLPRAEKIAGVTLIWNAVRDKFVFFDHVPTLDWNKAYLEYIEAAICAGNTLEYYRVLQRMCALLHDGHTNVFPPKELEDSVYARPPLRTVLVDTTVVLWKVLSDSLSQLGLKPGQEVVAIDGVPVRRYAEDHVQPFVSSSSPQDLRIRTYTYSLLAGSVAKDPVLTLREGRRTIHVAVRRAGYGDSRSTPDFEYRLLDHNIAYVALNSFGRDTVVTLFRQHFDELLKADALVLDLRLNGGGSDNFGYAILSYLTNRPYLTSRYALRASPDNLSMKNFPAGHRNPQPGKTFDKPIVLLVGPMTFSAGEDFAVAFDAMKRGTIIGEPTGGSTGQPYTFDLPGGLHARVCMKRDAYPDGREFVGIGLQPHIVVGCTIGDIRNGCDAVLDTAMSALLKSQLQRKQSPP